MPSIAQNRTRWVHDWQADGDEWSSGWGGTPALWHGTILPRIHPFVPARRILEIAPGHGRCTQYLVGLCRRLTVVDLVPECIEHCRRRFRGRRGIRYHVNDGKSLGMVRDGSVDFAFSWDSLVHAEGPVMRAYVTQLGRKLAPGGWAFLHHSNLAALLDEEGKAPFEYAHWRGRSVEAGKVREWAQGAGLGCRVQELVPWGGVDGFLDCFTLLRRPVDRRASHPETRIVENDSFSEEVAMCRRLAEVYCRRDVPEADPASSAGAREGELESGQ